MILEIADFRIQPGRGGDFDVAIKHGVTSFIETADGYVLHRIVKGVESPERYVLLIYWETLESHTVAFRGGPRFAEWRAVIAPYFAAPPVVEHFVLLDASNVPDSRWLTGQPPH